MNAPGLTAADAPLDPASGTVVVVGGGLAAARLCSALRRKRFRGRLVVLGREEVPPYDRPPLSKDVLLGRREDTSVAFDVDKLGVDLRLGVTAEALDTTHRVISTDHGELPYDRLAIATGADPLRLPGPGPQMALRTSEDALTLRSMLTDGARVVVVGASWIGAELTTGALAHGCRPICLEVGPEPLANALGREVGAATRSWWDGVDLRTDRRVRTVDHGEVLLEDGDVVAADVVVAGIGVRPAVSWLEGSAVAIDRGVLTDARCRTTAPGVVALGDVAQRWSDHAGAYRVVEHWDEASGSAACAAATILDWDEGPSHDPVPYFWSDQFGRKLQYVGIHAPDDEVLIDRRPDGSLARARWVRAGHLTAWLGVDRPRDLLNARTAVGGPVAALD